MSGCLNCLLSGRINSTTICGSLPETMSGSFIIPAGVSIVSLTGAGGIGTQTGTAQIGDPLYPSGLPPYIAPTPSFYWVYDFSSLSSGGTAFPLFSLYFNTPTPPQPATSLSQVTTTQSFSLPNNGLYDNYNYAQYTSAQGPDVGGQGNSAYPSGLPPYQASTISYTYGISTSATLNAVTDTWAGGYGPVQGTTSTKLFGSNGLGQTLTYSIGAGGYLNYCYVIGTLINGVLSGSGTVSIPSGVLAISLTGAGGEGTQTYNPGQPYVAATYGWTTLGKVATNYLPSESGPGPYAVYTPPTPPPYPNYQPVSGTPNVVYSYCEYVFGNTYQSYDITWLNTLLTPEQQYIAPFYTNTVGPNTTATLNAVTKYWIGGSGPVQGTTSTQISTSNGLGQTLTYSIGAGGFLNYSYTI
jgi:hypothetical protein